MSEQRQYARWIRTAVKHARFWLRKAGLNAEQRRRFWLALAERERREGDRGIFAE